MLKVLQHRLDMTGTLDSLMDYRVEFDGPRPDRNYAHIMGLAPTSATAVFEDLRTARGWAASGPISCA